MNDKNTDKLDSAIEPISIVESPSQNQSTEITVSPQGKETSDVTSHKKLLISETRYWTIVEYTLAFVTPFFLETFVIAVISKLRPYQHSDFFAMNKFEMVLLLLAGWRIVPPTIGLLLAFFLSKVKTLKPLHKLYLWLFLMLAFIVGWMLYCRQINPYWY